MRSVLTLLFLSLVVSCSTAEKPRLKKIAEKKSAQSKRKKRDREAQDETNFTLGEPINQRLRPGSSPDDRFTKSYGRATR